MSIKFTKKLLKLSAGVPTAVLAIAGTSFIVSCDPNAFQPHNITYVSCTKDYFVKQDQTTNLIFKFNGDTRPSEIETFEINDESRMAVITKTHIPLDENGEFLITLSVTKNVIEMEKWEPSFIATYEIDDEELFEVIKPENLTFTYDAVQFNLVKIEPEVNITIDQPVKYTFSTEAYQYINLIDSVELYGDAESILDLPISTSITLDQDHMFQLTLIPKASIPGKAGDLPLGFKFNYKHDQQTITARFDSNYNFFYVDFGTVLNNNFAFASYNQVITKAMGITLPKPYKVSKINHIDLVSDTAETAITLVNADNIEVDENGYFLLKFKNWIPDEQQGLVVAPFHLVYSFNIDGFSETITFTSKPYDATIMYNEPYDNHAVKINAISDGTVAFRISRKDSKIYTNNYFITYTINDGEAQVYNLSEYEAPLIELKKGDALYVRNYSDYLNQVWSIGVNDYIYCDTTMPFTLQGDVSALLYTDPIDPENVTPLTGHDYCFYGLFGGADVYSVSDNFLPSMLLSNSCYRKMFFQSQSTILDDYGLFKAPSLPAITAYPSCYQEMFYGCKNLITPPKEIYALTPATSSFQSMFAGCKALEKSPILDFDMDPTSPYQGYGCWDMFNGCSSLKEISMRTFDAKKKPFNFQITQNWVLGVPQSGTFYYNGGECTRTPYSIPRGWTIKPFPY